MKDMRRGCEVVVVASGLQIKTEADYNPQLMQLAMVRATRPETRARWSWTIAAPNMYVNYSKEISLIHVLHLQGTRLEHSDGRLGQSGRSNRV